VFACFSKDMSTFLWSQFHSSPLFFFPKLVADWIDPAGVLGVGLDVVGKGRPARVLCSELGGVPSALLRLV